MLGDAGVLTDGGVVFICAAFDCAHGFLVVFLEPGGHATLGFADVDGVAWIIWASGAGDVVDHRCLVGG